MLERGEMEEAEHLLQQPLATTPLDGWVTGLLRAVLNRRHTASSPPEPPPDTPDLARASGSGPDPEALRVGVFLREILLARAAVWQRRVEQLLVHVEAASSGIPDSSLWLRLMMASVLQTAFRFTGRADLGERGIAMAEEVADRVEKRHMAILARGILGTLHLLSGHFHTVFERCGAGIELARATGLEDAGVLALCHQFRGYVLFEWNRLADARDELERAWALSSAPGVRSGVARMLVATYNAMDDPENADTWFQRLEEIVSEPMTLREREWLAAVRIRRGAQIDRDLRAIDAWRQSYHYHVDTLTHLPDREISARLHEYEHLLTILEVTRQWDAVLAVAECMLRGSGQARRWYATRAIVARATALEGHGHRDDADASMKEALEMGRPGGFVRVYLDGSPLRLELLRRARDHASTRRDADYVLATVTQGDMRAVGPSLSPRQLEVLRQVATGLSNRAVARELKVAETTVKTHLRAIYSRLGVRSRTAAVSESRRIGLV